MELETLLDKINTDAGNVSFDEVIAVIDANYLFTPTAFRNGGLHNAAGQNSGSCRLFAFARMHELNEQQTLQCFGDYYCRDVRLNPEGDNHQNIRNFMRTGWAGIEFDAPPLSRLA